MPIEIRSSRLIYDNNFLTTIRQTMRSTLLCILCFFAIYQAVFGQRAAFLVGVNDYPKPLTLTQPTHDVDSMKRVLAKLGFRIYTATDVSNAAVHDSLKKWFKEMPKYQDIFFFFSGHGFSIGGNNYLEPNDFKTNSDKVDQLTLHLYYLLDSIKTIESQQGSILKTKLIFLDACREYVPNWYLQKVRATIALNQPETNNLFVGFASIAGLNAYQSKGQNSYFTQALKETIDSNATDQLWPLMAKVKNKLDLISDQRQVMTLGPTNLFSYQFLIPPKPCPGCDQFLPTTNACYTCTPDELSAIFPNHIIGLSMKDLQQASRPGSLQTLQIANEKVPMLQSALSESLVGPLIQTYLQKKDISPKTYILDSSYVLYQFQQEKLAKVLLFIRYTDLSFHRRIASAVNINLNKFTSITYLGPSHALTPKLPDAGPKKMPLEYGLLFGKLPEYSFSIIEFGPYHELFDASADPAPYYNAMEAMHLPIKKAYQGFRYKQITTETGRTQ